MDTIDKTEKELQAMPRDQQFLELVRRKLRKVNKKMQRITQLEQNLKTSKAESNNDQKQLLASKEMTLYLQKELSELQNQMLKIIGDKKESTTEDASAASGSSETAQKDKKQRKKNNKQKADATSSENAESKVDNGDNATSQSTSSDSTNQTTQADQSSTPAESSSTPAQTNQEGSQQASTNDQTQDSSKAQRSDRPPKAKKEWELQKDIYVAQFKQNFGAEHDGKYIAVKGGKLFGPYDTQEQRTNEIGASIDKKDPTVYLARIGEDNKRQRRPKAEGQDGADRPPRRDGGSGGRGGAPRRDGDRQGSNNNGSFSSPKRGGGNGRGGRGGRGNSNGSPSQGRPQQVNQAAVGL